MDEDSIRTSHNSWHGLDKESAAALAQAASFLTSESIIWHPEYGCALLVLRSNDLQSEDTSARIAEVSLQMVCLDSWAYKVHRSVAVKNMGDRAWVAG